MALATIGLMMSCIAVVSAAPSSGGPQAANAAAAAATPVIEPVIDWGKCPQLAPTELQRKQKTEIIKACLEKHPLTTPPDQLNAEIVDKHRIQLGECALTKEDWVSSLSLTPSIKLAPRRQFSSNHLTPICSLYIRYLNHLILSHTVQRRQDV